MNNHWSVVTLPAHAPEPEKLERVEFHLSDADREKAEQIQAYLELCRNERGR